MEFEEMKTVVARNPFAVLIGMELLEAADGYARARIRWRGLRQRHMGIM